MAFSDDLDDDMEEVFLNTDEYGEAITYYRADGTTLLINAIVEQQFGAIDRVETARALVSTDSTLGVADPYEGEQFARSGETRWTIIDVRTTPGAHDLRALRPVERV